MEPIPPRARTPPQRLVAVEAAQQRVANVAPLLVVLRQSPTTEAHALVAVVNSRRPTSPRRLAMPVPGPLRAVAARPRRSSLKRTMGPPICSEVASPSPSGLRIRGVPFSFVLRSEVGCFRSRRVARLSALSSS